MNYPAPIDSKKNSRTSKSAEDNVDCLSMADALRRELEAHELEAQEQEAHELEAQEQEAQDLEARKLEAIEQQSTGRSESRDRQPRAVRSKKGHNSSRHSTNRMRAADTATTPLRSAANTMDDDSSCRFGLRHASEIVELILAKYSIEDEHPREALPAPDDSDRLPATSGHCGFVGAANRTAGTCPAHVQLVSFMQQRLQLVSIVWQRWQLVPLRLLFVGQETIAKNQTPDFLAKTRQPTRCQS